MRYCQFDRLISTYMIIILFTGSTVLITHITLNIDTVQLRHDSKI